METEKFLNFKAIGAKVTIFGIRFIRVNIYVMQFPLNERV